MSLPMKKAMEKSTIHIDMVSLSGLESQQIGLFIVG